MQHPNFHLLNMQFIIYHNFSVQHQRYIWFSYLVQNINEKTKINFIKHCISFFIQNFQFVCMLKPNNLKFILLHDFISSAFFMYSEQIQFVSYEMFVLYLTSTLLYCYRRMSDICTNFTSSYTCKVSNCTYKN